jgi:hypothetical protein
MDNLEDSSYSAMLADMVLVDTELNDAGDLVFAIKHAGQTWAVYDAPIKACDHAAEMAANSGCKWDVTIQARHAGDMW